MMHDILNTAFSTQVTQLETFMMVSSDKQSCYTDWTGFAVWYILWHVSQSHLLTQVDTHSARFPLAMFIALQASSHVYF